MHSGAFLRKNNRNKLADALLLSDNTCAIIEEINVERLSNPETTYNFEVEDFHTYYVTGSKVLVHNKCVKIKDYHPNNGAVPGTEQTIGV